MKTRFFGFTEYDGETRGKCCEFCARQHFEKDPSLHEMSLPDFTVIKCDICDWVGIIGRDMDDYKDPLEIYMEANK